MYDVSFAKLSERFFKTTSWPPVHMIADLVDGDHVFCLLYKVSSTMPTVSITYMVFSAPTGSLSAQPAYSSMLMQMQCMHSAFCPPGHSKKPTF